MKVCPTCQNEYPGEVDFCPSDGMKLRSRRTEGEDPLLGRALDGRWIIEEKLGEGGMGAVYRGHQRSVNRTVAIKTLRPQLVDSEEFVDRFFREAQIAGNISHPHCVTILDYGESEDGTLFLAMEFLDGESLTDRLESGSIGIKQVIQVGIQVASALSAAHEQNIVHRDLKPDNIFLIDVPGGATFAKVLDFGIAKMLDSNTQMTKTGMIFGTPEYMSPEQCRGGAIDGRSDLYSLGCILYELIGGRTPFGATTPMAVLMAHVNQTAPALSEGDTAAHVPPGLEQIIMRLLEKDPEHRFQSATQVRQALENELQMLDSHDGTAPHAAPDVRGPMEPRQVVADAVEMGFDETVGLQSGDGRADALDIDTVESDPFEEGQFGVSSSGSRGRLVAFAAIAVAAIALAGVGLWFMISSPSPPGDAVDETVEAAADEPTDTVEPTDNVEPEVVAQPEVASDEPNGEDAVEAPTDDEPSQPAVAATEKTTPKKRETKREPTPTRKTRKKPERKQRKTAKAEPKQEKSETPKPRKRKTVRDAADDIDRKAEKASKDVKKKIDGVDEKLDNALDGLLRD